MEIKEIRKKLLKRKLLRKINNYTENNKIDFDVEIPLNNNTFIPMKNNLKTKFENKRKKGKENSNFDPISKKLLDGKIKINIQFILIENLR